VAEQTYRAFVVLDLEADEGENLPKTDEVTDAIRARLERSLRRDLDCGVQAVEAYPDSINEDIPPPHAVISSLKLISTYLDHMRDLLADNDLIPAADVGLRQIESGISYLRGCLSGIAHGKTESCAKQPEVRLLNKENLEEAPEPLLHLVAHRMGLKDCAGMSKPRLIEWIKNRIDEEEAKIPKPN
jgi:hypothetical protein